MRKILVLFLAIAFSSSVVFSSEPDKLLHTKCLYPTVFLLGETHNGTGFVVKSQKYGDRYRNVFVTCAHNAESSFPIQEVAVGVYEDWSKFIGYKKYNCYYYASDSKDDVAVGVFETTNQLDTVDLDFDSYYIGDEIVKVGCGLNDQFRIDYGRVTAVNSNLMDLIVTGIRISAYTVAGDSGGPVIRNYKVIGITRALRAKDGEELKNIAYATPIRSLKNMSAKLDINIDFAIKEEPLPTLPFFFMRFNNLEEEK